MSGSIRLGRLAGIALDVHFTFLLLLGFVAVTNAAQAGLGAAVSGVVFIMAVFACVVLHEYGHALMARVFGIQTRDITLLPIGGLARLERMPADPRQELLIALAGPAVNVVIAALLAVTLIFTGTLSGVFGVDLVGGSFLARLLLVNVMLVLFNLLPAFPMDGGRVLRAYLATRVGHAEATRIATNTGKVVAVGLGVLGLLFNPMLVLIALFVWFGASQEALYVRQGIGPAGRSMDPPHGPRPRIVVTEPRRYRDPGRAW